MWGDFLYQNLISPNGRRGFEATLPKEKRYPISDGQGMYLEVAPNGSKYWRLKYRFAGKEMTLAFGVFPEVSLKEACISRDKTKEQD